MVTSAPATLAPADKVTKAGLVEAMIASDKTTFREDDRDILSSFSETLLTQLLSDLEESCQCPDGTCTCQPQTLEGADAAAPVEGQAEGDRTPAVGTAPAAPAAETPAAPAPAAPAASVVQVSTNLGGDILGPPVTVAVHLDGKKLADAVVSKLISKPTTLAVPNQPRRSTSGQKGAPTMRTNRAKDLALRLIACEEAPFVEGDLQTVLQFSEERLFDLVQHYTPDNPPPQTEEEWLATAPETIRDMVIGYQAEDARRRSELVLAISASQDEYTKEQLSSMKTMELNRLGKALGLHKRFDYSGRGMPRPEHAAFAGAIPEPPEPYTIALEKRAKEGTTH